MPLRGPAGAHEARQIATRAQLGFPPGPRSTAKPAMAVPWPPANAPRPIRRSQTRSSVLDGDETQFVDLGLEEFGQLEVGLGAAQLVGQFKR